jgi:hypothetical protein
MGLDASVMCNCYAQELTTPPPFPAEFIQMQDGFLVLNIPETGNEDEMVAKFIEFDRWVLNCCEHEDMDYALVWVANWRGYRLFQEALARAGWHHFPTLRAELPNVNGGLMPAALAPEALGELRYFREYADLGTNPVLVNSETGEEIFQYVAHHGGDFILDGRYKVTIGFDKEGLFIRSTAFDPPRELFRSMHFEQRLLESQLTETSGDGRVQYIDLQTGYTYVCMTRISGGEIPWPDGEMRNEQGRSRYSYPRYMHIEERKVYSQEFEHILEALTEVFQASIETGNPVRWT